MQHYETQVLQWQGLDIEVRYCASWLDIYRKTYGYSLAHLDVKAACPLPFAETGYESLFERTDFIEQEGGPAAYVLDWLETAALDPAWIERQQNLQQLTLF